MRIWLAYVRKSVVRDDTDLESPERQLSNIRKALEITENEPFTIKIFQDLDRSGISEEGRSEWLNLKAELDTPGVIGVIGNSLDRLYRNVYEFLAFLSELEKRNLALRTAKEFLDTSNPLGRFVVTILMAMYEMESRLTSVRMKDMIEDKRRGHGRHWGGVPFGCDRDENGQLIPTQRTYTIEEETRYFYDALTECFRLYSEGKYSYQHVAQILNTAGWRFYDRYNKTLEWNEDRVRGVVGRWRLYQGQLPLGNPIKNRSLEYVDGGHQPILPIELCNAAGNVLDTRSRLLWSRVGVRKRIYLLSDFTYCAYCGMKMIGQFETNSQRRIYRHKLAKGDCPSVWVDANQLEQIFIAALHELINDPEAMENLRNKLVTLNCCPEEDNTQQLKNVHKRLERLEDLYINEGAITKEAYLTRRNELLSQLAELQPKPEIIEDSDIVERVLSSIHLMEHAEETTKKALLSALFDRLEVDSGTIRSLTPAKEYSSIFLRVLYGPGGSRTHVTRKLALVNWLQASINQGSENV
jgi:DNA invertase Pin-like site-specific DNA recombinase